MSELSQEKLDSIMNSTEAVGLFDGETNPIQMDSAPENILDSQEEINESPDLNLESSDPVTEALDALDSAPSMSEEVEVPEATETVFVRGLDGKREKLEIDYANRESIKQAHLKAAGMRKFQRERDLARKELQSTKKTIEDFTKLETAFESDGVMGVVKLLGGDEAWSAAIDKEMEHRNYVANLSATEKYQYEAKQREESYEKQLQEARRANEDFRNKMQEESEASELRQLESKLIPSFDRYRVELDDPAATEMINESIWKKAVERIEAYPENVSLTKALVDKEFRKVASVYKSHLKNQAEKTMTKQVSKKKQQAMKKAQVSAKKGLSQTNNRQELLKKAATGDLEGALRGFFNG